MFNLDEYETVESRLEKFWAKYPNGRTETKLLKDTGNQYIVWSAIYRDISDPVPFATGLAEETVQGRGVNSTSALENAETSSLGRSLANGGFAAKGKRASREELAKVQAKVEVENIVKETKEKLKQSSGAYVPVPAADDPWKIVPTQQGQTLGEAVEVLGEMMGAQLVQPKMIQCKHGDMKWSTGTTKAGKPWGQYRCTTSRMDQCRDVVWFNQKNGQWIPQ